MESQTNLFNNKKEFRLKQELVKLEVQENTLEREKFKFLGTLSQFVESLELRETESLGRPKMPAQDIIKSLLVMSYNGMSYRLM